MLACSISAIYIKRRKLLKQLPKKNFDIAWLNVNRGCNNRCTFCYAKDAIQSCEEMPYREAIQLLTVLRELSLRKIILIGGEPTIYPNIIGLVKAITGHGMSCTVQSNGIRFADIAFLREMISAGMTECGISIKGFSEEEYAQTTGTRNYPLLLKAIDNLAKLNYMAMFSYVLSKPSLDEADKLILGVKKLGLKNIYISPVHPTLCEADGYAPPDYRNWVKVYKHIISKLSTENVKFSFGISFPLCAFSEEEIVSYMRRGIIRKNCCQAVLGNGLVFDTDFRLLPCNMFVKAPFIKDQKRIKSANDIYEIMNTPAVKSFYEWTNTPLTKECQACYRWSQCHAGCRARWTYENPEEEISGFNSEERI